MEILMSAHHLYVRVSYALSVVLILLANRVAKSWKAVSWMEHCEHTDRDNNHNTLKNNELGLVAHELAPPATCQLGYTIDATHEDADVSGNNGAHEAAEACLVKQRHRFLRKLLAASVCAKCVFGEEVAEEGEGDDLENNTSNHQISANILKIRSRVCSGCETTTCALKNEREQIASDEDARVPNGSKT